jgi:glucose/arabinose dehydrogenase
MNSEGELVDEQVLIDNIAAQGGNHNGGDLQFGRDGLLYISVGDAGRDLRTGETQDDNRNARRLDLLNGKILRITPEGAIPASNPFQGPGTARCNQTGQLERQGQGVEAEKKTKKQRRRARKRKRKQRRNQRPATECREIFATGLRNPYRIAFDPDDSSRFYINDVGGDGFEEINEGSRAADYGWNVREGPCPINDIRPNCVSDDRFEDPVFSYRREPPPTGCRTITGGAFVPDASNWPGLGDAYLFADLFCSRIFALEAKGTTDFASGEGASHLAFGPDGNLYYTAIFDGEVRKITYRP